MASPVRRLAARLSNLFAVVRLAVIDDSGPHQRAQATIPASGAGAVAEIIDKTPRLAEYGFDSCPPDGSEAVVLFLFGRRSAGVIIATGYAAGRPKDLKPGEAMVFNALTQDFVKLCADGKLRSKSTDWLHEGDAHVSGTAYAAHVIPADGVTGTFVSQDGKHITVTRGVITSIA